MASRLLFTQAGNWLEAGILAEAAVALDSFDCSSCEQFTAKHVAGFSPEDGVSVGYAICDFCLAHRDQPFVSDGVEKNAAARKSEWVLWDDDVHGCSGPMNTEANQ